MPYDPTVWVGGLTTVGPTNLNKIEQGLVAAAARADSSVSAFNPESYGADPTGVADSTAAIQAAMNACGVAGGGVVYLPAGTYKISSTLVFNYGGVRLRGAGWGQFAHAAAYAPDVSATTLSWAGGVTSAAKMISANHVGQISVEDITLTGNRGVPVGFAGATYGIYWLDVTSSMIRNVSVKLMQLNGNAAGTIDSICLYMAGTASGGGSYFNVIENVTLNGATGLYLDGDAGTGNDVTESTFRGVLVAYGSNTGNADGIIINYGDGNDFFHIDCIHNFGSGYGMRFKSNARANRFFGVAATVYVEAPASASFKSTIYGLSRQDNIPAPTGPGVSAVDWIEVQGGGSAAVWQINSPLNNPGSSFFNVKGYGAVGDGATDDTTAVQAAINAAAAAGGGIVWFPKGVYKISSPLGITSSGVQLLGGGYGATAAAGDPVYAPVSVIRWAATAPGTMISASSVQGIELKNLALEGGTAVSGPNNATTGILLTDVTNSKFRDLSVVNMQRNGNSGGTTDSVAIHITSSVSGSKFNLFENLHLKAATLILGDSGGAANCTINTFVHIMGSFGSSTGNANGIVLTDADDNTFMKVYVFRDFGTGYGVYFGVAARNDFFYHLYPSAGGAFAATPSTSTWTNQIIGYQRGDGAPTPVLSTGAHLTWTEDGVSGDGGSCWHLDRVVRTAIYAVPFTGGGANVVANPARGEVQAVTVTDGTAFTFAVPFPVPTVDSQDMTIEINNQSGGAMGAVSWAATFVLLGGAFTTPANNKKRFIRFFWNGLHWIELFRSSADYVAT